MKHIINEDELKKIVEKHVVEDKELSSIIFNIVVKINDLKKGTKTSIAELLDYNPKVEMVDPLTQGKVSFYVEQICKQLEMKLVDRERSFGGLAYFVKFKKG